jgi:glycosyltransferase involved in cell wall biosynthesis
MHRRTGDAMHILCFLPDFGGGGAQRTVVNLANAFADFGERVALCSVRTDGAARAWVSDKVEIIDLGCRRVRQSLWRLREVIRERSPDVLFASMVDANILAFAAHKTSCREVKLVLRETNSHLARGDLGKLRRMMVGMAYRRADSVVALSCGVGAEITMLYSLNPSRVCTIGNPVNIADISAKVATARLMPPPLPRSGPVLLAVGRLTWQKGFDRLIRMFARLPLPDANLVILGEGEARDMLVDLAAQCGVGNRVVLPGFVQDVERWFAHADVLALPSRWEGFGHVIVEAMAAGLPVVAYDCPHGPRDIIRNDENGILVPADGDSQFAAALQRLLTDETERRRFAKAGIQTAECFARNSIATSYLDLFRRL